MEDWDWDSFLTSSAIVAALEVALLTGLTSFDTSLHGKSTLEK